MESYSDPGRFQQRWRLRFQAGTIRTCNFEWDRRQREQVVEHRDVRHGFWRSYPCEQAPREPGPCLGFPSGVRKLFFACPRVPLHRDTNNGFQRLSKPMNVFDMLFVGAGHANSPLELDQRPNHRQISLSGILPHPYPDSGPAALGRAVVVLWAGLRSAPGHSAKNDFRTPDHLPWRWEATVL